MILTGAFPIDLSAFKTLALDPAKPHLTQSQRKDLAGNIQLARDAIIFFTAISGAKGLGGHTGGAYDIVPEVLIIDGFIKGSQAVLPYLFDEAGHRVAIQYLMAVLNGHMPAERLLHYREFGSRLPGHPERDFTPGIHFSSGRLGHMWPYVNGIAMANPDQATILFGSDGSQQEGNNAEAARLAVAQKLNVKIIIDDNDITIAGSPSRYLPGFDVARTLTGHGLPVDSGLGEDLDALYSRIARALASQGPVALVNKRKMAPGVPDIEGTSKAHEFISVQAATKYFLNRDRPDLAKYLEGIRAQSDTRAYRGSNLVKARNRDDFGKLVSDILDTMPPDQRRRQIRVIDSDLEGSCGLHHIRKRHPEIYVAAGVMERGNFSAAAGFGFERGRQGIFSTFSAFMEMVISEITMARLNHSNVLCHFAHAGVDDMADNTCHFGINNLFADNGLPDGDNTALYFPADRHQFRAVLSRIFFDPGIRFIFSTRSSVPDILASDGSPFYAGDYAFEPGRDDIIRRGTAGYIVSYGEMLYRSLDAVERLREEGIDIGLVNKTHLNFPDEAALREIGGSDFVLVVETQSVRTGLGSRLGSYLLERGYRPKFAHLGVTKAGDGGLGEQVEFQGLGVDAIMCRVRELLR